MVLSTTAPIFSTTFHALSTEISAVLLQLLIGFLLAGMIGLLAWRWRALSVSGAIAATITGGLVFGLGGISWAIILVLFFLSSNLMTLAFARRKAGLNEKFAKGSQRDAGQVLANGGLPALLAIIHILFPGQAWVWFAFIGALAAVNADTWATEIGTLSSSPPRLLTTGRVVERGASGGVSLLGSLAAIAGASLIGLAGALLLDGQAGLSGRVALAGLSGGFIGSLCDSILGASVQAIYRCPVCSKETEHHPWHTCGAETKPVRGWRWLNNDWVNVICSLVGALAAWLVFSSG